MSKSEETLAGLVQEVLLEGPRTGFEIARGLRARFGVDFTGREGSLYALLLLLERQGWVGSQREGGDGPDARTRYVLPVLAHVGEA